MQCTVRPMHCTPQQASTHPVLCKPFLVFNRILVLFSLSVVVLFAGFLAQRNGIDWLNLLSRQPKIVCIYMGGGDQAKPLVCHLHHHISTSFTDTCSSKRSSQSLWLATTFTSLLAPFRPIPHSPASPSLPSKVILTSSTQTVRPTQQ